MTDNMSINKLLILEYRLEWLIHSNWAQLK